MELRVGTDSYVTLEEANDYVKSYYLSNSAEYISWFNSEVSDDDRRAALRQSALSLNNLKYTGRKKLRGQSLAFPRVKPNYGGCGVINTLFISQTHDNSLVDSGSGGEFRSQSGKFPFSVRKRIRKKEPRSVPFQ